MKKQDYIKAYTQTGQLDDSMILMVHPHILDADKDPVYKLFRNKKDSITDAQLSGWEIAGTAPLPVDAEPVEAPKSADIPQMPIVKHTPEPVVPKAVAQPEPEDDKKQVSKVVKKGGRRKAVKKKSI